MRGYSPAEQSPTLYALILPLGFAGGALLLPTGEGKAREIWKLPHGATGGHVLSGPGRRGEGASTAKSAARSPSPPQAAVSFGVREDADAHDRRIVHATFGRDGIGFQRTDDAAGRLDGLERGPASAGDLDR